MENGSDTHPANPNPNLNILNNRNPSPSRNSVISGTSPVWPTIDGPLGLSEEDSLSYARRFYKFGFAMLPWLWAVNCFYFWPVLRHSRSVPHIYRCISLSLSLSLSLCARVDFVLLRNLDECSIIKLIALSFTGMCLLMLSLLVCRSVSVEIFMI
jgi:hypothetical protein